jgi:sugar phosphate isomerase/epimerase
MVLRVGSYANIGEYTRHVHVHDAVYDREGQMVSVPFGSGWFDHLRPWHLLSTQWELENFKGFFSVEVIHKPGSDHDGAHERVLAQYAQGFSKLRSSPAPPPEVGAPVALGAARL